MLVNGEIKSLKKAFDLGEIKNDDIVNQVEYDSDNSLCGQTNVRDGGTRYYEYDDYIIIKFHSITGFMDLFIVNKDINPCKINEFREVL